MLYTRPADGYNACMPTMIHAELGAVAPNARLSDGHFAPTWSAAREVYVAEGAIASAARPIVAWMVAG